MKAFLENMRIGRRLAGALLVPIIALALPAAVFAEPALTTPSGMKALITPQIVSSIRTWLGNPIVRLSIQAQNERFGTLAQEDIERLDKRWRAEREAEDKPLIAARLSNPLSVYLLRVQARSLGLYPEIFVMDRAGLNVGQSSITADFWQGDEAKYQRTFQEGPDAVFVDEPEWDAEHGIWRGQVSLTLSDDTGTTPIGAATVEFNLTELIRRQAVSN